MCNYCERDLSAGSIPKFSLVNGLWVGDASGTCGLDTARKSVDC